MSYYRAPDEAVEGPDAMREWLRPAHGRGAAQCAEEAAHGRAAPRARPSLKRQPPARNDVSSSSAFWLRCRTAFIGSLLSRYSAIFDSRTTPPTLGDHQIS